MNKQGPFIRRRLLGRLSDGSDRSEVEEQVWVASFVDDLGSVVSQEFDHDPTEAEVDALTPRRVNARTAVQGAVQQWQAAQTAWSAATTTSQALNALHLEHVAIIKAIRALAFLSQIDD